MNGTARSVRLRRRSLLGLVAMAAVLGVGAFNQPAQAVIPTALSIQASPSVTVGESIAATSTLSGGLMPTGAITFRLYGPSDPACAGVPAFTSQVTAFGNGSYTSASYPTPTAGTYRWTVAYTGDLVNYPAGPTACETASAAVTVTKRFATVRGRASVVGSTTSSTATIDGAGPSGPTGTLTFRVYGPYNMTCSGPPLFTSTSTVAGAGPYTSGAFAPSLAGTYQWVATYSGDANNYGAGTSCADPANNVGVVAGPTVALTVSPPTAAPGTKVTVSWSGLVAPTSADWVGLYAVGAPDSAIRTWTYTTGATSGSVVLTVPWGTPPGSYEARLFGDNSMVRLATAPFTVT